VKLALASSLILGLFAVSPVTAQEQNARQQAFPQVFSIRGIEFSREQEAKVDEIRKEYTPKLIEIQRARTRIYTDEQRQARNKALQAARDAGKTGQELRDAVDKSFQLTEEQQQQLAKSQKTQAELAASIQKELQALLTADQRKQIVSQQPNRPPQQRGVAPTHRDVKYGPDERNVMDVWLAKSDQPTPVLVSIHGGGFRAGNKSVAGSLLNQCLESGISVVAITYRFTGTAIAPAQHHDAARAIQFIRHNAKEWNIDPTRFAATGGSAGAGISLWLGFHDDLADPDNADPVLRESTRLSCMSVYNGQTSYDPRFIRDLFPGTDTYKHSALAQLFDADLDKLDDLPQSKYDLFEEISAINHLDKNDVPAQLIYAFQMTTPITNQGIGIHHPKFGMVLKEKMDKLGLECDVQTGVRRGADEWTEMTMAFVKKHLGVK
jgi:acetyl esterase/lipase